MDILKEEIKPITPSYQNWKLNAIQTTRLNPQTNYRDRYWVFQVNLIKGLIPTVKFPTVLFLNDEKEISVLVNYFESYGYYTPSSKSNLRRRVELLHESKSQLKILICYIRDLEKVLEFNQKPIHVMIDSLEISEKWYALRNSNLFGPLIFYQKEGILSGISNEEDIEESHGGAIEEGKAPDLPKRNDTGGLLELMTPIIDYYKFILFSNHPNNQISLLDARLNDYFEVKRRWKCQSRKINLWTSKEAYNNDLRDIQNFFPAKMVNEDVNIDLKESMEKIRSIFIGGHHQFYPHQIPYLKAIIPAQDDLLVSLPTGGGKSILFQGPALYRSSFTRGLTLVITPLKALMEDQTIGLWKLGFWSSVDYLNQDKGVEVQNIYRRIAGGEVNLLFITPERFRSRSFENAIKTRMEIDGGLDYCVFDEAHCISQWGNEFRPDYQRSARITWKMKKSSRKQFPILLFSATVSEQIYNDFNRLFR